MSSNKTDTEKLENHSILRPGRNCWRVAHADKVAFLIDGANYFSALHRSLPLARHSIDFLCWDIHSNLKLGALDGDRRTLPTLLRDLLQDNGELEAKILTWNWHPLVGLSREWLLDWRRCWDVHPRLHFVMDGEHPSGASQHQKGVIIDDSLAFIGGLDLTQGRWDDSEHLQDNPKRRRVDGTLGRPYHDAQMAVAGEAAAVLGELFSNRWQRATGEKLERTPDKPPNNGRRPLWPQQLSVDLENVDVAISRTEGKTNDRQAVREIEQLYVDSIRCARQYIYFENQYFTAPVVTKELCARLQEKNGPEVIINLPLATDGWLAQNTMDVIRIKSIRRLRKADKYKRLGVYYPFKKGLKEPINLHAKLSIVDDRFVRIGSSNINNRSMALDTECDLAIETTADNAQHTKGIQNLRNRLLAEHLGVSQQLVADAVQSSGSVFRGIEALREKNQGRTLKPLESEFKPFDESLLTEVDLVDPEQPIEAERLIKLFIPERHVKPARLRITLWICGLIALIALSLLWRFTGLSDWLTVDNLLATIEQVQHNTFAPLLLLLCFVAAGVAMVPITLLIVATIIFFGAVKGFIYAIIGATGCAIAGYAIGDGLGKERLRELAGDKVNEISQRLAKHGVLTVTLLRIVPVAPFTIINLVAGASHIKFRDFVIGTVIGLAPALLAITLLTDRVKATIQNPDWASLAILSVTVIVILGTGYLLLRKLAKFRSAQATGDS